MSESQLPDIHAMARDWARHGAIDALVTTSGEPSPGFMAGQAMAAIQIGRFRRGDCPPDELLAVMLSTTTLKDKDILTGLCRELQKALEGGR